MPSSESCTLAQSCNLLFQYTKSVSALCDHHYLDVDFLEPNSLGLAVHCEMIMVVLTDVVSLM